MKHFANILKQDCLNVLNEKYKKQCTNKHKNGKLAHMTDLTSTSLIERH